MPPSHPLRSDEVAAGNVTVNAAEPGFWVFATSPEYKWPQGSGEVWIDLVTGESCSALAAVATPSCKQLVEVRRGLRALARCVLFVGLVSLCPRLRQAARRHCVAPPSCPQPASPPQPQVDMGESCSAAWSQSLTCGDFVPPAAAGNSTTAA